MSSSYFPTIIYEALNSVQYSADMKPQRFLAAIQDLAIDYPQEKKFLYKNMDNKLLGICNEALSCRESQLDTIQKKASLYIQEESHSSFEWADEISKALVSSFFAYGHSRGMPQPEENQPEIIPVGGLIKDKGQNKGAVEPTRSKPGPEEVVKEEPSDEADRKGKKKKLITAAAFVVAVGAGLGLFSYFFCTVPDVVGLDETDAEYLIEDAGLVYVEVGREFTDTVEQGCVIEQDVASKKVRRGTKINILVSRGEPIPVPDLKKKSIEKAKKKAETLGLIVKVKSTEHSDTIKKDQIIRQNPKAGTYCEKGDVIEVVKSKGLEEMDVPDVVGETAENAKTILEDIGFKVATRSEYSRSYGSGIVIRQSEKAGEKVEKNSTITITVSLGRAPAAAQAATRPAESKGIEETTKANTTTHTSPTEPEYDEPEHPASPPEPEYDEPDHP